MGGVWKKIPYTTLFMLIGTLALTGFPFLSGFYSKDAIIEFAFLKGSSIGNYVAVIGIFTAFLTSIYSWRLFLKTFFGEYKNKSIDIKKVHESPLTMTLPLLLLAIGSIAAGFIFKDIFIGQQSSEFWGNSIFFIEKIELENIPLWLVLLTPIIVLFAIPISYYLYQKNTKVLEDFKKTNSPLYNFLLNKWYVDELYDFLFVNPIKRLGLILEKR